MPNAKRPSSATAENPIFIVGTHYSGTRLLALALATHPKLVLAAPTSWLPEVSRQVHPLFDLAKSSWSNAAYVATFTSEDDFYEDFGRALAPTIVPAGRMTSSQVRWVDCSPSTSQNFLRLLRLFPKAKVIHLAQDINVVVQSLSKWPVPGESFDSKSASEYWLSTESHLAECQVALGSEVMRTIPGGALYGDFTSTLKECLRFLGEDPNELPAKILDLPGDLLPAPCSDEPPEAPAVPIPPEAEVLSSLLSHTMAPFEPNARVLTRLRKQFAQSSSAPKSHAAATVPAPRRDKAPPPKPRNPAAGNELVSGIRELSSRLFPKDARVMVVTKGDDDLLMLGVARASHFPQQQDGKYAGFYPANSQDAIKSFEAVHKQGHDYFILPAPYFWWLSHYTEFASHLHKHYSVTYFDEAICLVFDLAHRPASQVALLPTQALASPRQVQHPTRPEPRTPAAPATKPTQAPAPPGRMPTRMIATKLWSGYSTYGLADLNELLSSAATDKADKLVAAWELARWHTVERDYEEALKFLHQLYEVAPGERLRKRNLLLEIDLNLRLGHLPTGKELAAWAIERYGFDTDVLLACANAFGAPDSSQDNEMGDERLEILNLIYDSHGLMPLKKLNPELPLGLDNIAGATETVAPAGTAKLSVIMPAHNACKTIAFAIQSLLRQTWANLEVILVDDASEDETPEIVSHLTGCDPRVKLVRLCENNGAYVARNAALPHVTGDYVTVHDADDWSHPQKIELQMAELMANQDTIGLTSSWIRVSADLRFNGTWRPGDFLVSENLSSLIVNTNTMRALGGWDPVKVNADDEFRRRLEARYKTKVSRVFDGIPLALALDDSASLTRDHRTHVRTEFFGLRRDYRLAFERWHARAAEDGDFYLDPTPGSERRFPVPRAIVPGASAASYDIVLACNYALTGGAFISAFNYILASLRSGLRVGIFDWRRYENDLNRPADKRLLDLIDEGVVGAISAGDDVTTRHLVFCHPPILQFKPDRLPNIAAEHVFVTVNQMAERLETGSDVAYEPATVKENLVSMFGHAGSWFGISPGVRQKMCDDPRYPDPEDVIWTELIDTETWRREPVWRGRQRETPTVGRHGRDHYTKWPSRANDIADAYCVNTGWDVQFLGGAAEAIKVLGYTPPNWTLHPFDSLDVYTFLDNLDFLMHFPHEDYIEEYGRVAMEAMALGIPVLLPHKFASTFGEAGIYCRPQEVPRIIRDIWQDEAHYLERGRLGLRYVDKNCSFDQLVYRLNNRIQVKSEVTNGS